jgi:hypothetical protein
MRPRAPERAMRTYLAALAFGVAALIVATVLGGAAGQLLDAVATPPVLVRAMLVGASAVATIALLWRAVAALAGRDATDRDLTTMIRGVRLAFLAVAAVSAGIGWLVGHALPLVIGLVIAGVDVVETTFLLIVARTHHDRHPHA